MTQVNKQVTSPQGRIVSGDAWNSRAVMDFNDPTKPKLNKKMEQIHERYIGLAIPKTHPAWDAFYAEMYNVALQGYNNAIPANISYKMTDGDDPKFAARIGYPGCWIINLTNQFEVGCYDENGNQLMQESELTCGDYADVLVDIACDGHQSMPSIYMAHKIIRRAGRGEKIVGGPSIGDMAPAQGMAPGATAVRAGTSAPMAPVLAPAPVTVPVPAPAVPSVTPQPPVVAPPAPPPSAPLAPVAPTSSPTEPVMTAAATATRDAYLASGWTDAQLIEQGLMIAPHGAFVAGPPQ